MHVTRLAASDAQRYRALMLHAYASAADAFTSTPEERAAEPESWWVRRIADPKGLSLAYGAFHNDELVGTVTIEFAAKPKTRHKAHLIGMFVSEQARGLGAGRALVNAALSDARSRPGVRVVTLTVTQGNVPALALYESCGFSTFGIEPMAIATPDGFRSKVHMLLNLGQAAATAHVTPSQTSPFASLPLPQIPTATAPDGSDVRVLLRLSGGSMAHFELGPGRCSAAVRHKTVEELWFVVSGQAQMWRCQGTREEVTLLTPGTSLSIPLGTCFQFKTVGPAPFAAVGVTMPPWPSHDEAEPVAGPWQAT